MISVVTFLSPFLRSFCLFVCFLSHKIRKTCLCALADSCLRSFLRGGLTVGPPPLPAVQATKTPPAWPFIRKELLPSLHVKPWHPLKETWGEEGSRGRWLCAENLPSALLASLAEGLPRGPREVEASHTGHCVHPGSLDLTSNSPKKEIPMGYSRNLSDSAFTHLSFGLASPRFPSAPKLARDSTCECPNQLASGFRLRFVFLYTSGHLRLHSGKIRQWSHCPWGSRKERGCEH